MLSINEKKNIFTVEKLGLCANVLTDAFHPELPPPHE